MNNLNGQMFKVWSAGSENYATCKFVIILTIIISILMLVLSVACVIQIVKNKEEIVMHTALALMCIALLVVLILDINSNMNKIKNNREIEIYIYSLDNYIDKRPVESELSVAKIDRDYAIMCKDDDLKDFKAMYGDFKTSYILDKAIENEAED